MKNILLVFHEKAIVSNCIQICRSNNLYRTRFPVLYNSPFYPRRKVFGRTEHKSKAVFILEERFSGKRNSITITNMKEGKIKILCQSKNTMQRCRSIDCRNNQSRISRNRGHDNNVSIKRECWVIISTWQSRCCTLPRFVCYRTTNSIVPHVHLWLV